MRGLHSNKRYLTHLLPFFLLLLTLLLYIHLVPTLLPETSPIHGNSNPGEFASRSSSLSPDENPHLEGGNPQTNASGDSLLQPIHEGVDSRPTTSLALNSFATQNTTPYPVDHSDDFKSKYPNCTKEWVESLYKRKWVYHLFPDAVVNATPKYVPQAEVESYVSTICNLTHLLHSPIKVWRGDGGGPETDPKYENYNAGMLDDPNCISEMGQSSRPISDEEFLKSKFVAVYYFAEQTTKAMRHLNDVISLAKNKSRILILPRVGSKTRAATVSMGGYLPLCTYFNITSDVDWVTYEFYHSTALRLNFVPSVGFKCHRKLAEENKCVFDYDLDKSPLRLIPLLLLTRGQYPTKNNTVVFSCFGLKSCRYNGTFVNGPKREHRFDYNKSLLVFSKSVWVTEVYGPPLPAPAVAYSSKVITKGDFISESLKEYGAIHVRLEHLCYPWYQKLYTLESVQTRFMACVESLVSRVQLYMNESKSNSNSSNVRLYMASDISNFSVQSSSWLPTFIGAGLKAFNYTRKHLDFVMFEDFEPTYAKLDPGIHGIVDKMVCAKSKVFFTGTKFCGGKQNFDKEILAIRTKNRMKRETTIYWGNIQVVQPLVPKE